ncbi:hypothetical protein GS489_33915 [Rhodococcus hoagii]|nr:hypothetical protein [Prescottella equi]
MRMMRLIGVLGTLALATGCGVDRATLPSNPSFVSTPADRTGRIDVGSVAPPRSTLELVPDGGVLSTIGPASTASRAGPIVEEDTAVRHEFERGPRRGDGSDVDSSGPVGGRGDERGVRRERRPIDTTAGRQRQRPEHTISLIILIRPLAETTPRRALYVRRRTSSGGPEHPRREGVGDGPSAPGNCCHADLTIG